MTLIADAPTRSIEPLFRPVTLGSLSLPNRLVMAPMTRRHAPEGIPGPENVAYYARRIESGIGLIVTEGTWIPHPTAGGDAAVPRFYGDAALAGWKAVLNEVHRLGGRMFPQLWHEGMVRRNGGDGILHPDIKSVGPSGLGFKKIGDAEPAAVNPPMTESEIADIVAAFGTAAASAAKLGFDGIELHGAHGYLFDQFFWKVTNRRTDRFGGDIRRRSAFAAEVVRECRRQTRPDFPICLRFSQWKVADYNAKLTHNPAELAEFLEPLVDAGVDIFHCSTRRYWDAEFADSPLSLAGWTRKISGKATILVGAVGIDRAYESRLTEPKSYQTAPESLDRLMEMLDNGEFDLVAVGRALLADHEWARKMREGRMAEIKSFSPEVREIYY